MPVESLSVYREMRRAVLAVLMVQLELNGASRLSCQWFNFSTLRPRNQRRTSGVGSLFGGSVDKTQQCSHRSQGWRAGSDFGPVIHNPRLDTGMIWHDMLYQAHSHLEGSRSDGRVQLLITHSNIEHLQNLPNSVRARSKSKYLQRLKICSAKRTTAKMYEMLALNACIRLHPCPDT